MTQAKIDSTEVIKNSGHYLANEQPTTVSELIVRYAPLN